MPKFGSTEKSILASALIVFLALSYLLYDDSLLFSRIRSVQLNLIGNIVKSNNDVRRKNFDTFSWVPAFRKDPIYENDSIFTGERSEAELHLSEGAVIKVAPNSLITLNLKNGQMLLDLRYGNIDGELTPGTAIAVKTEGEEFILENRSTTRVKTRTQIKKDHNGKVKLKLLSGQARFTNIKTRKQAVLTPERPAAVAEKGFVELTPLETPLLPPPAPVAAVAVENPEIQIITENPLRLLPPPPQQKISLEWKSQGSISQFEVVFAKNEDFLEIVSAQKTTEKILSLSPAFPSGNYFWKVVGLNSEEQTIATSPTQVFQLLEPEKPKLSETNPPKAPVLITKNIDFKVPTASHSRGLASQTTPTIQWKGVENVKSYQLQISKDRLFTKTEKYEISQTQGLWKKYRPGQYHFRVIARGINGLISDPSEVGKVDVSVGDIKLDPLESKTLIDTKIRPAKIKISWNEVPFAQSYAVHFDKSSNFEHPEVAQYKKHQGELTLNEPGTYHVRVQALDEQNNILTDFSNSQQVTYTFRSPLPPPTLLEPFNMASIFLQTTIEPFIWLEWKNMESATAYDVEISDHPDFSQILIAQKNLVANRYLIKDKLPLGTIYWRVRAHGKTEIENSTWTEKREFTLYSQKNETFEK